MRLLVLAGGFGTRLKSAVGDVPKALAPVGRVPFLKLQLEHWLSQGLRDFTFLLHHQAEKIVQFLEVIQSESTQGARFDFLIEPTPMGTGGSIANAVKEFDLHADFLVTNADTWVGYGVSELMQAGSPSMLVVRVPDMSRYGQVHFEKTNLVVNFSEKNSQTGFGWINAGFYRLPARLFNGWDGKSFSLERDFIPPLAKNLKLIAVPVETDFLDIGMPSDYLRFCKWVKSGRRVSLCS